MSFCIKLKFSNQIILNFDPVPTNQTFATWGIFVFILFHSVTDYAVSPTFLFITISFRGMLACVVLYD